MYNDIKLEKTLYNISGKSFTQTLSELDPDEEYKGTELEGLDAYERQLKRFDIKVNGKNCDTVDKFFACTDSAVLFPEFVRRQVIQGFNETFTVGQYAASNVLIDDTCFRTLTVEVNSGSDITAEGQTLPSILVKSNATKAMNKFGRTMDITYEMLRKKRIDTFAVILKQLGVTIARSANNQLIYAVCESTVNNVNTTESKFNYDTLVELWKSLDGFEMDTIFCSKKNFGRILQLDELKNMVSTGISADNSTLVTPFGVTIIAVPGMDSDQIVGFSSKYSYEVAYGSDLVVDIGKLISNQYDQIGSSVLIGISRFNDTSLNVINISSN